MRFSILFSAMLGLAVFCGTSALSTPAPQPPMDGAFPIIVNGDFEHQPGKDLKPEGWDVKGKVLSIKPGALGRQAVMLVGGAETSDSEVRQRIPIPQPLPPVVTISSLIKTSEIDSADDDEEGTVEIKALFLDEAGSVIGAPKKLGEWFGSFDWKPWTGITRVPPQSAQLEISLRLNGATGGAWFDEVEILWGFPADRDTANLLADGGFEYVNSLSEWKLGSPAHKVVFPGLSGRSSLRIRQERPSQSETDQEIVLDEVQKIKSLRLSSNLKLENVIAKKKRGGVEFRLEWFDERGRRLKKAETRGLWKGSFDWTRITQEIAVPHGALRGRLRIKMERARGTAFVDDLRLEAFTEKGELLKRRLESRTNTETWKPFQPFTGPLAPAFDAGHLLDPPAGKHGYLGVKDGRFVFEDGTNARFFGVNIQAERAFPPHEEAKLLAERLAQYGFNLVRLHHLDAPWAERNIFDPRHDDTQHFSKGNLDRLDYFIAQLKSRGIHIYIDLLVSRQFKRGDRVPVYRRLEKGAKMVAEYHPRLIELQKKYAKDLLTHLNPYTESRYVDEPALVLIDLINESSLLELPEKRASVPQVYLDELGRLWKKYAGEKKITDSETGPPEEFYADLQLRYFKEMSDFLHGLGLKIPIAGSNLALEGPDLAANARLDFIDRHAYWDHPKGGFGDLVKFNNNSMVEFVERHNPIVKLSRQRVEGKPFVVSEWNIPWPNEYLSIGPVVMAAYALFQDWDGLVLFNYGGELKPSRIQGNFDLSTQPELFLQFPAAARLFHRRDVSPASEKVSYSIFSEEPIPPSMALLHGIERTNVENKAALTVGGWGKVWVSDTEEIYWDEKKGIITLNTPRTQAVLGKAGDGVISLSAVKFHISTPFVSLILTSLDNESLAQSSHLLLAAVARSENAGTIYNPSRTLLRTSGTSPILMEPVLGQASLTLGGRPLPQVFALDPRGNRVGEIPVEESHGALEIPLRGAHAYEILFGEKA